MQVGFKILTRSLLAVMAFSAVVVAAPPPVVIGEVQKIPICDEIEALGTAFANESVTITSNATEKIESIHFEDGAQVDADDILVSLDRQEEKAQLDSLKALMIERKPAVERAKILAKTRTATQADLEERQASLQQLEADIKTIEARIKDRMIRAPFSGTLGFRQVSVGSLIEPADTITRLFDLSSVKVSYEIPARYLAQIKVGQNVISHTDVYPNKRFVGKISAIDTELNADTRTFMIRVVIPNDDRLLKPGLLMKSIIKFNKRTAVFIPEEALFQKGTQHFVFRLMNHQDKSEAKENENEESGKTIVELQKVVIGTRKPGGVEILEGINPGEQIVIRGFLPLQPQNTVSISEHSNVFGQFDITQFRCEKVQ